MTLILASQSPIRRTLLANAGVSVEARPAGVDEQAIKAGHRGDPASLALALAAAKAVAGSHAADPDDWVIGSDSLLSLDGRLFDKPADRDMAAEHLRLFAGRSAHLISAAALARDGEVAWAEGDQARLTFRAFDDEFINAYLDLEWPAVGGCVGVFRLEGTGVQLFETIEGDHFTVLGLPLLPLLRALRERGLMPS